MNLFISYLFGVHIHVTMSLFKQFSFLSIYCAKQVPQYLNEWIFFFSEDEILIINCSHLFFQTHKWLTLIILLKTKIRLILFSPFYLYLDKKKILLHKVNLGKKSRHFHFVIVLVSFITINTHFKTVRLDFINL